jgi:endonuclease YncB( thermonuclease family)
MRCSRPALFFLVIIPATCCSWPAKVVSVADGDTIIVLHKDQQQPD